MAHIVEFSVKGLSGRKKDINITLNRDINVFFGLNGSGKTSLLKILHSAMSNDASILKDVPFLEAKVVIYSINANKNYEYKITKELHLTPSAKSRAVNPKLLLDRAGRAGVDPKYYQEYLASLGNQIKWEVSPATDVELWRHRYLPISRLYVGSVSTRREQVSQISEDQLDARFSEILQQIWMQYSYDINSRVREAQEVGLANILRELLSPSGTSKKTREKIITPDLALERVKRFLSRQEKKVPLDDAKFIERYSSEPGMRNVVRDIDQVERDIEQAVFPIERLNTLIQQLFGYDKKINFSGREIEIQLKDGTTISPQQLSSGEKHLLKLFIEVVSVADSSIIIDEPELSLHIDWQKTLLQNMNILNPSAQLIVATHSPEVMSGIEDSKIFRI
jgi:predicted ATPase